MTSATPSHTLVIGGCRSGKSTHALDLARDLPGTRKHFVATCVPRDAEMMQRVRRHQEERDATWRTHEEPLDLAGIIDRLSPDADALLIDCLTLWISNLLMHNDDPDHLQRHAAELTDTLARAGCPVILVTNEVGAGIVPENRLARLYRDTTGWVNQRVAAACERVILTVAGIPVTVKPAGGGTCDG